MSTQLRVLIVEDSPDDAELVLRELRRGGYDSDFERVETPEEMAGTLKQQDWEVILCDYNLPAFSAPKALELLTGTGLDIPFIVVSGTIGEQTAVEMMRAGAGGGGIRHRCGHAVQHLRHVVDQADHQDQAH